MWDCVHATNARSALFTFSLVDMFEGRGVRRHSCTPYAPTFFFQLYWIIVELTCHKTTLNVDSLTLQNKHYLFLMVNVLDDYFTCLRVSVYLFGFECNLLGKVETSSMVPSPPILESMYK